ncbi:MAG: phosphoribosylglycinamide formyltransferase [Marinilabiliaceae bacterium]|nr:phosphoribosylglycinamide formyltransferase [Marinilabiliaceae bacterium]
MKYIAIFASGNGSNAENIANYFGSSNSIRVGAILCNNSNAYVVERAKNMGIPYFVFSKEQLNETGEVSAYLHSNNISFIVLAGFLWLLPQDITAKYDHRILNIHPSLLPKYGGKGMYGNKVHQAVIDAGDVVSGITIHRVNEYYDDGDIVCQKMCTVEPTDTAESLALKVHALEYEWYPKVIENEVTNYTI